MSVATLRPSATTFNTGTVTGAATAHAALSDDSDSSYVTLALGQGVNVDLSDLTLPAGALVSGIALRARMLSPSGTSKIAATVTIPDSPQLATAVTVNWAVPVTVTVSSRSDAFTDAQADGMALGLTATVATTRVHELYLDVTYVAQPVTSVTAPAGTVTDTNQPAIIWMPA